MRLRVVGVLSLISLIIVVAVAASMLASASRELTNEVQTTRVAALDRFAQLGYDAAVSGDTEQLQLEMDRYSDLYGEGVLIRIPQATVRSGGLTEDRADVAQALSRASLNLSDTVLEPLQPLASGTEVLSRPFGSTSQVLGEAVIDVDLDTARHELGGRWLTIGLAGLGLWVVLLVGAAWVTRWILQPVHHLTAAVVELEQSGRAAELPGGGPPELRRLSRAFSRMARTVGESLESQRQLIADASHQLRNPVGALRLRLDLLQLELAAREEEPLAARAGRDLDRVEEILDGLLRLAAAEHRAMEYQAMEYHAVGGAEPRGDLAGESAGESAREPAGQPRRGLDPIDPQPVLQDAVERATPAAGEAGVTLELAAGAGPDGRIRCDAADLADMVDEAIGNALKYAPGARIAVSTRPHGDVVTIEVADTGPGLPDDERAASTTRFWRSPRHRGIKGTGLGMAIVDRLAGANGAHLELSANSPHGLVVRLEFPRRAHPHGGERQHG